ncbi:Ras-related protein Rab-14 [Diplonema papillatum]|nr:Ras-related protein Rab-14 [Diplonema papillatum]
MSGDRYDADLLMKFILIGNSGTGKSCILHRFIEDKFIEDRTHTIGVEFGAKVVELMGKKVKLQIWDTAGQERYRSVTRSYYRGAVGCLLVYDITNRDSYAAVSQWLKDARVWTGQDVVVMLVGNKADIGVSEQRQVTHIEASQLAQQEGLMHFETSAVTGEFIEEAFLKVAKTVLMRQQKDDDNDQGGFVPSADDSPRRRDKSGCSC